MRLLLQCSGLDCWLWHQYPLSELHCVTVKQSVSLDYDVLWFFFLIIIFAYDYFCIWVMHSLTVDLRHIHMTYLGHWNMSGNRDLHFRRNHQKPARSYQVASFSVQQWHSCSNSWVHAQIISQGKRDFAEIIRRKNLEKVKMSSRM